MRVSKLKKAPGVPQNGVLGPENSDSTSPCEFRSGPNIKIEEFWASFWAKERFEQKRVSKSKKVQSLDAGTKS